MKQMKRITLRLCLENPNDREIADFLDHIDKKKYHTVNSAIKEILYEHIRGTAPEATKSNDIVSVIKSTLETEIPKLFAALVSGTGNHTMREKVTVTESVIESNSVDDDVDIPIDNLNSEYIFSDEKQDIMNEKNELSAKDLCRCQQGNDDIDIEVLSALNSIIGGLDVLQQDIDVWERLNNGDKMIDDYMCLNKCNNNSDKLMEMQTGFKTIRKLLFGDKINYTKLLDMLRISLTCRKK